MYLPILMFSKILTEINFIMIFNILLYSCKDSQLFMVIFTLMMLIQEGQVFFMLI